MPDFDIIGSITNRETIARGNGIRDLERLRREHGSGTWLKRKGKAKIQWRHDGAIEDVEIHWYEAHGVGASIRRSHDHRGS